MKMFPRAFPSSRRKIPKRQAERRVYQALAGNDRQGFCYYEWRRDYGRPELDFAIWMVGLGRIALQVKGGRYRLIEGEWHLKTRNGVQPVETSPLDEVWLEALDLHDDIEDRVATFYNPFVIPVVMFPDMDPDPAIEHLARRKGVYLAWRTDDLVADLIAIVRRRGVADTLTMDRTAREVEAVTDGLIRLAVPAGGEIRAEVERPTSLSLWVGGRPILQVQAREVRLRRRTIIGPGAT